MVVGPSGWQQLVDLARAQGVRVTWLARLGRQAGTVAVRSARRHLHCTARTGPARNVAWLASWGLRVDRPRRAACGAESQRYQVNSRGARRWPRRASCWVGGARGTSARKRRLPARGPGHDVARPAAYALVASSV